MNYTLIFRKNGVEILSLGTGHALAAAFLNKPYDNFKPMAQHEFADAMFTLIRQDESLEDAIEIYNQMAKLSNSWEERWDALDRVNSFKKERKDIAKAKVMLEMLEMVWEEGKYSDDGDKSGLEWAVL